jgi:TPP-dependent 2-oxoacid decarboxylase
VHEQPQAADESVNDELTQDCLWDSVEKLLPSDHRVLADIGTSFWGLTGIRLPHDDTVISQSIGSSTGWTLPATLGCRLADPDRRSVLVIGDRAAQMTLQELSILASSASNATVILINSSGRTIERAIQSCRPATAALSPGTSSTRLPPWRRATGSRR